MEEEKKVGEEEIDEEDFEEEDLEDDADKERQDESGKEGDAEKQEPEKKQKSKQSPKENAHYAEMRRKNRELEEKVRRLESEKTKVIFDGRKNAIPESVLEDLGLSAIEDEDDLFLAEKYLEAEKNGSDNPASAANAAYRKRVREQRAEQAKAEEKAKTDEIIAKDLKDLEAKYGKDGLKDAMDKEGEFAKTFGKYVQYGGMTELYGFYLQTKESARQASENARKSGTPPLPNGSSQDRESGEKSVEDMSDEEFEKWWNRKHPR